MRRNPFRQTPELLQLSGQTDQSAKQFSVCHNLQMFPSGIWWKVSDMIQDKLLTDTQRPPQNLLIPTHRLRALVARRSTLWLRDILFFEYRLMCGANTIRSDQCCRPANLSLPKYFSWFTRLPANFISPFNQVAKCVR